MQWTSLNDIREKYLSFFESKGHLRLASFPLIPRGDRSLLLINSGMAPMKKYFTGEEEPPRRRVTTCQKCIRTPDLERVGHTARHGTFFEMLGNFSFGDYFKEEAVTWSWEFLTEVMKIPADLLWPSVYEKDDETYDIWKNKIGVPAEHIVKLGKGDNFWEHGPGPCGPCSEIYFDRGPKYGCGRPDCRPGCDCDRYMEIWNNVFTQFSNDGKGNYTELEHKNIDTGMGLERLACVIQGVDNMFEVDTIRRILDRVVAISGREYGRDPSADISIRVVTDHTRSAVFMIADGVLPSNEGRGYVLRRIIRRACRHGKLLGIDRPFLSETVEAAIAESYRAYPELAEKRDYILKVVSVEEERFDATIDAGLEILGDMIAATQGGVLSGDDAFKLYDTYGFPVDLTRELAAEAGLQTDEARFAELMQEQRSRARAARGNVGGWENSAADLLSGIPATEFTGYGELETDARVLAVICDGELAGEVSGGTFTLVLDRTPFYGEGGGQVGDTGTVSSPDGGGLRVSVTDTKKADGIHLHICTCEGGTLRVGDKVRASVDRARREAVMRNHSSLHLLQAALRQVLGKHVEQAGSYVDAERGRFDFTHFAALTKEELAAVEAAVNGAILSGLPVETVVTGIEEARGMGAIMLFGEKYGDTVRVVRMGGFSAEFCGGTHVANTAKIGLFRIVGESSVASGVRRIESVTGTGVLDQLARREKLIAETAAELKVPNPSDIARKAQALQAELSAARREIESLNAELASTKLDSIMSGAVTVGCVRLATARLDGTAPDVARSLADRIKSSFPDAVAVLAVGDAGRLSFIAVAGADAVRAGAHAGRLVSAVAAVTGGRGGGRPDNAMAGGRDASLTDAALSSAAGTLAGMLKG